ncbi:MAG: TIGR02147 family protein [Bacteriovoracaceae bacterium]|nr:TIGR02147 family protein [Bacteriovoracaceae bacterium]
MNEQLAIQSLLRSKLAELQNKNSRYSLRAFANKVGVHVGALSSILNGRRNISRNLAARISQGLLLDPQERSEILGLFPDKRANSQSRNDIDLDLLAPRYLELNASHFKIIAEWEHFAILSLLKCADFQNCYHWISRRLGITMARTKVVMGRLVKFGLVEVDNEGILRRSKMSYRTADDVDDLALKKNHDQSFELARKSLFQDCVNQRDFTSMTMAIGPKKLNIAKERIRKFQDELSDLLESGHQVEVYRLSMQLFPLSKKEKDKKDEKF